MTSSLDTYESTKMRGCQDVRRAAGKESVSSLQKVLEVAPDEKGQGFAAPPATLCETLLRTVGSTAVTGPVGAYVRIWPFQDTQKLCPRNPASLAEPGVWG